MKWPSYSASETSEPSNIKWWGDVPLRKNCRRSSIFWLQLQCYIHSETRTGESAPSQVNGFELLARDFSLFNRFLRRLAGFQGSKHRQQGFFFSSLRFTVYWKCSRVFLFFFFFKVSVVTAAGLS